MAGQRLKVTRYVYNTSDYTTTSKNIDPWGKRSSYETLS